jgi:hypothetical protein
MSDDRVRREIALRAANLMYTRDEAEYYTAKRKAARQVVGSDRVRDLPSNAEIREQVPVLANLVEGDRRFRELQAMRIEALRFLRLLRPWRPRLIGSVLTGHIRAGSDIDLHAFCASAALVADVVEREGYACEVEYKRVLKAGEQRVFTHIHLRAAYPVEITVYGSDRANFPFRSSITGNVIERASEEDLERVLRESNPEIDIEAELCSGIGSIDPYAMYETLLRALDGVKQDQRFHPESDALYHSLQVFDLARMERAYDQDFLLAALLHDIGKAIDPRDHVNAGVEALDSERTEWLIAHHMEAHRLNDGSIPARARRRLMKSKDFDDLMLLGELDRAGRVPGVLTSSIAEALEAIRALDDKVVSE